MKYLMDLKNNGKAIIHKQYDFYNLNAKVCAREKIQKNAKVLFGVGCSLIFLGISVDLR